MNASEENSATNERIVLNSDLEPIDDTLILPQGKILRNGKIIQYDIEGQKLILKIFNHYRAGVMNTISLHKLEYNYMLHLNKMQQIIDTKENSIAVLQEGRDRVYRVWERDRENWKKEKRNHKLQLFIGITAGVLAGAAIGLTTGMVISQ